MRILLDECVPRPLKREFAGHDVRTVREMGWTGKKNGELIQLLVADGFEAFVTVDQNLSYQQNLRSANVVETNHARLDSGFHQLAGQMDHHLLRSTGIESR